MAEYKLKEPVIEIYSYTPVEDVKAKNSSLSGSINTSSGVFSFEVVVGDFKFDSALMQEHFNEKYMESASYPKSSYSGKISGSFDLKKDGIYPVITKGDLTLHGKTNSVEIPATFSVANGSVHIQSEFKIKIEDYQIPVPKMLFHKVAEIIDVKVSSALIEA